GKCSPMSRPPVSVPAGEWHALQKPSTRALPRAIRSGVASTSRSGTGALRACCLTVPTIVSAAANDTATANTAASPMTPHFTNLFLIRKARTADHTSDVAAASIVVKPRMLAIPHHPYVLALQKPRNCSERSALLHLAGLAPAAAGRPSPRSEGMSAV